MWLLNWLFPPFVEIPIRVKSKIVDAFQIHVRWTEEIALLKGEMSNLLCFYTEKRIPALKKDILELEDEIKSWGTLNFVFYTSLGV